MALPRLRAIVRSYVLDSLRESEEYKPENYIPNETLLSESSKSGQVRTAYVHHQALTLFINDETEFGDQTYATLFATQHCFANGSRVVLNHDGDHDTYHQSPDIDKGQHTHILKNKKAPHELLSLTELKCIFNDIKEYEKAFDLCKDGKTECMLTDADQIEIEENFAEYIRVKNLKMPNIELAADAICNEFEGRCIVGAKTLGHIFLTTFIDKYIKPYLIDTYHDPRTVSWIVEIIKSFITFALVLSLFGATLDVIIRNGLKLVLKKHGIEDETVDTVVNRVSSVVAFTQNPLSIIEVGINDTAADVGQKAAYAAIRLFPKLREEPAPAAAPVANHAEEPVVPGLRHRRPGMRSSSED